MFRQCLEGLPVTRRLVEFIDDPPGGVTFEQRDVRILDLIGVLHDSGLPACTAEQVRLASPPREFLGLSESTALMEHWAARGLLTSNGGSYSVNLAWNGGEA